MFDLDREIAAWKTTLAPRCGRGAEVAELEDHLRSEIESLVAEGTPAKRAFELAVNRLGRVAELDAEYDKNRSLLDRVSSRLARWDRRLNSRLTGRQEIGVALIFATLIISASIVLSAADISAAAAFGYLLVVIVPLWLISRSIPSRR